MNMATILEGSADELFSDSNQLEEGVAESSSRKRSRKWLYCSHCKQEVPKSTYYRHKKFLLAEEEQDIVFTADNDIEIGNIYQESEQESVACNCSEGDSAAQRLDNIETVDDSIPEDSWHIEV